MQPLKNILQSKIFYLVLIFLTILYVVIFTKLINYQSIYNQNQNEFIGTIQEIKKTDYGYSLIIKSQENLIAYTKDIKYKLGDLVLLKGTLKEPSNNTVLNNFNYKEYLKTKKIFYTLDTTSIELIKENKSIIFKLKNNLINYLDTFKSKNFLKSFILGDTSYLGNDLYKSYQINGICHLLSIGSTHITFLSMFLLFILKKIKLNNVLAHLITFTIIFFYILLTNYQIALVRVYIYLVLSFLNKKFNFNLKSLNLFFLTTFITLFLNPFLIYNRGFLYSYSISFILILNKDNLTGNYFMKIIKVSLIAFLYSIPFNIYFNYSINLLSVFYNLIYVPAFNLVVFPLALVTTMFPFLDNIFYQIMTILNSLSYFFNKFTFGIIILKKMPVVILIIYLGLFTYLIHNLFQRKMRTFIILFLILTLHVHINEIIKKDMFMIIDVKQGDSSLLYVDNKTILIDTGGIYMQNNIEKTITMLYSLGLNKIDYLILTHGDFDHMGDSLYLVNNFKVLNVIFNNDDYNDLELNLIKELDKKKIKYYKGIKELKLKSLELKFLNTKLYDNENDNSNVIYFKYNNLKFLLMGDASTIREYDILNTYNLENIDFLKVGHHGSNTSSSERFIKKLKPKYSFISVGLNNRYGHPKDEVLKTLELSKIYRTDKDGSIEIDLSKNRYSLKTYNP